MMRNVVVNHTTFFYPLGNTPAVCLTQDLPPELDADILLLGCGDARSILYTTYADSCIRGQRRKLDITCCDIESAIIARNILLFTLICDQASDVHSHLTWEIYYHFRLSNDAAHLLGRSLERLCEASKSRTAWQQSTFAEYLSFCNQHTLQTVHDQWTIWRQALPYTDQKPNLACRDVDRAIEKAKQIRKDKFTGVGMSLSALRSAAPTAIAVLEDIPALSDSFWQRGSLFEKVHHTMTNNPTFAPTLDDNLVMHYGTEPLLGFHLAEAYAPCISDSHSNTSHPHPKPLNRVVEAAQKQFAKWSNTFKQQCGQNLKIRFIVGDALAVAFSLKKFGNDERRFTPRHYRDPWTMDVLKLDDNCSLLMPLKFDVIDTSNLIDHLGPLHVLTAVRPLLKSGETSTLYIEVLVRNDSSLENMLDNLLCGDLVSIAHLLGLVLVEYLTNASTISNVDEGMFNAVNKKMGRQEISGQYRTRMCWRAGLATVSPKVTPQTIVAAEDLVQLMFGVYAKMFAQENVLELASHLDIHSISKLSNPYYTRASFAALLHQVRAYVTTDWQAFATTLVDRIEDDTSLMLGRNYLQELYVHLHLSGLYSPATLSAGFQRFCGSLHSSPLSKWKDLPFVVAVTLEVPRSCLKAFSDADNLSKGTPSLCCSLESPANTATRPWSNIFAVLQVAFGKLQEDGSRHDDDYSLRMISDKKTWSGKSNMIVSFLVPTWTVLQDPVNAQILLSLQSTPQSAMVFMKMFPMLRIFETITGDPRVYITKNLPNLQAHPQLLDLSATPQHDTDVTQDQRIKSTLTAGLNVDKKKIATMCYRLDLIDQKLTTLLQEKSTAVEVKQATANCLNIVLGRQKYSHAASFPLPVLADRARTRIARKSSYIEVIVPLATSEIRDRLPDFMFPMCRVADISGKPARKEVILNYNAPFIDLDNQPLLDTNQKSKLDWLNTHTTFMFSGRERKLRESIGPSNDVRTDFKDGLFSIFMHSSGLQGVRARCFGLQKKDEGGVHVLLFVSGLRLDLGNHTVVLDAAVLPLDHGILQKSDIQQVLSILQHGQLCTIQVSRDELKLWKTNFPVFAERCRTWSHNTNKCEYFKTDRIPSLADLEDARNPLCSCGRGKIPADFIQDPKIPGLNQMLRKYATRVAIAPCFAVPYVEDCFSSLSDSTPLSKNVTPSQSRTESDVTFCWACKKKGDSMGKLLKCGRCKTAWYCSAECQKKDWSSHKADCALLKNIP